ncbi:MAG: sulfite exporter TauE/SafE family protein [Amphiplicatus sp.]
MEFWQIALLALVGFASGWINVLAGGGSLFTVPVMVFLGMPGPMANGTNRISIVAQNLFAVGAFRRKGFSDFRLSATLSLAASIGAYVGAMLGVDLAGEWFERTVALTMIAVMILMATGETEKAPPPSERAGKAKNVVLGHILMVGAGFWGGFIQIGVGFLIMPILYRVMGLDLVRVNMHKVFIVLIFSAVAFAVFAAKVPIAWGAGAALGVGTAAGGWLGAHMTIARGAKFIKRAMLAALAAMAVKLLFF